ncbi:hypothetical protein MCOR03_004459 [Pyricularia oryzae]|nr:hypothetical protein MCOR03_004459 [Pyricularia oryzae]
MGCCCSKTSKAPRPQPGPQSYHAPASWRPEHEKKPTNKGPAPGTRVAPLPRPPGDVRYKYTADGTPWPQAMEAYRIGVRSGGRPDTESSLSPRQLPSPQPPSSGSPTTPSSTGTVVRKKNSEAPLRAEGKKRDPRQNRTLSFVACWWLSKSITPYTRAAFDAGKINRDALRPPAAVGTPPDQPQPASNHKSNSAHRKQIAAEALTQGIIPWSQRLTAGKIAGPPHGDAMTGTGTGALAPSHPTAVHQSLQDSLAGFRTVLTDEQRQTLKNMNGIPDTQAVLVFTAGLDSINRRRKGKSTSSRLHSFLSSVGGFCNTMTKGRTNNVVDTYVSSNPEIAALVWGSMKLAMTVLANFMSYYDGAFVLMMKITELCPAVSEYGALYPDSMALQKSLSDFYASVIDCCKRLVEETQRSGFVHFFTKLTKSIDENFKSDLAKVQHCRDLVNSQVVLAKFQADLRHQQLQAEERQEAMKSRSRLFRFLSSAERSIEKQDNWQIRESRSESEKRRQRLLDSLSAHDFMRPYKQSNERRYGNTTDWVFKTSEFQRWLDGESTVLWCSGKIGSGKTVVASSVIQHILKAKGSLGCPVSFFFAQADDADSLDAETILRSILYQRLLNTNISEEMELKIRNTVSTSAFSDVLDLLREVIPAPQTSYIVLDGLDECNKENRKMVLKALSALASPNNNVRLFLSARSSLQEEVERYFPVIERLKLGHESTNEDIAAYIKGFIDERMDDGDLKVGDLSLLDEIQRVLTEGAQGMFLWVVFQLQDICSQHSDKDIRQTLNSLPKDLAETFQRILCRIDSRKHDAAAQNVFAWVAASKRPLSLEELREALAIYIGQQYTERDRFYNDMENIASWCGNLVQIDEESKLVQFAHSAVRAFLSEESSVHNLRGFHLNLRDIDHRLGELCVTYLDLNDFKTTLARRSRPVVVDPSRVVDTVLQPGSRKTAMLSKFAFKDARKHEVKLAASSSSSSTTSDLKAEHPFLNYASIHWLSHTKNFGKDLSKTWNQWKAMVVGNYKIAQTPWNGEFYHENTWDWAHRNRHYALIRVLVTHSEDGVRFRPHLPELVIDGDLVLIDALLEGYWPPEMLTGALNYASQGGNLEIVKRLLAANTDMNTYTYAGGYIALGAAASGGHLEVVKELLASYVDVSAEPADFGGTALQTAAGQGRLEIVKILLAAKVEVNAEPATIGGRTALQAAAEEGHLEIVETLLAAKADVNACPGEFEGRTALQAAAEQGHLEIVKMLLAAKADVNAYPGKFKGRTALQAAAENGHLEIVNLLKSAGAVE